MKKSILALVFLSFSFFPAQAATTLLPNGKQCFTTATGAVVSGSMNMFFVGTTNPKPTWQDGNQVTLNTQPIQLDANGCAVLYGVGAYRQQLYSGPVIAGATSGTLLWDQITTDTSAFNSTFWAGISGGTPNVITVVDPGFNGTDGTVVNFVALATNTGAATINPSSFGAIGVVKDTASGPIALTGGEIIQNNIISVIYSASGNNFHLLNTAIATASGNTAPLCGATNLKIVNNTGTPNSIITVTADVALMVNAAGAVINRSAISQNINITSGTATSAAGGMDGEATGTNAWLYIWLIDNGSAAAGLATAAAGFGLTPNMPSGYTYKCRLGAVRVDNTGVLLRTIQRGKTAQYAVTGATNTAALPLMASAASGSLTVPTYTSLATGAFVPLTASEIRLVGHNYAPAGAGSGVIAAPNGNYGAVNSATNPPPLSVYSNPVGFDVASNSNSDLVLESTNIFYAIVGTTAQLAALGWRDQVNAN